MKFLRGLDRIDSALAALALAICFGTVMLAIFSREAVNASFLWTDELARYLIVWATYFGASAAIATGSHVRMEALINMLPKRLRSGVEIGTLLSCAAFTAIMTVSGVQLVRDSIKFGLVSTESDMTIPTWVFHLAIPLAFSAMTARLLAKAWLQLKGKPFKSNLVLETPTRVA